MFIYQIYIIYTPPTPVFTRARARAAAAGAGPGPGPGAYLILQFYFLNAYPFEI